MSPQPSLTERLKSCADLWAAAHESTTARLGRVVVNDTSFFSGLDARVKGPSIDTLEKFARYLAEPANWPDGQVPDDAVQFAHVCGVSAGAGVASAGKAGDSSPDAVAA
ncbi:hypothetical protein [Tsuneonella sp. HG222]